MNRSRMTYPARLTNAIATGRTSNVIGSVAAATYGQPIMPGRQSHPECRAATGRMRNYGVPMFRNLDEPRKARRVGIVLAVVAAVYLGITAIVVIGVMVDGPVKVVRVAAKPAVTSENCGVSAGVRFDERADCENRNKDVKTAPERPASLKEVPDWPMRIAASGGALLVASFFFSIVLGLAAIVARLSSTAPNPERDAVDP